MNRIFPYQLSPVKKLAIVACYYNPLHYRRPAANYVRWLQGMRSLGIHPFIVELAFDDDCFETDAEYKLRAPRDRCLLWQKERLLNYLIERLPAEYDAVAWIDTDILFADPLWPAKTLELLSELQVIQLFSECFYLNARDIPGKHKVSIGHLFKYSDQNGSDLLNGHCGFAWAARREWLDSCGLYEYMVTGGGDAIMMPGFTNRQVWHVGEINTGWLSHVDSWYECVRPLIQKSFGNIEGGVAHLYHGSMQNRKYVERWRFLIGYGYNPATDICRHGDVLAWSDFALTKKRPMVELVREYFSMRKEDD